MEILSDAGRRVANATGVGKQAEPEKMKCTYCGGTKFYGGPEGGMSQNVLCANDQCRHWFNHTPIPGMELEDLHKVEPTENEREDAAALAIKQRAEWIEQIAAIGADIYRRGGKPSECRFAVIPEELKYLHTPDNCAYFASDGEYVLDGYLEAMQEDIAALKGSRA